MFKTILRFFNIHPDKNQRWILVNLFLTGLLYTYVSPAITKEIITALPAEWLAFQSLFFSAVALVIGMVWKGQTRITAIKLFMWLCIAESCAGFLIGMYLLFIHYNVIVFAIATMLYSSLISEFVAKCIMLFKTRLWNEKGRETYDNNNAIVCSLFCIIGYVLSLFFMPSLETALAIWSIVCLTDDIAWLILYRKHKSLFLSLNRDFPTL